MINIQEILSIKRKNKRTNTKMSELFGQMLVLISVKTASWTVDAAVSDLLIVVCVCPKRDGSSL